MTCADKVSDITTQWGEALESFGTYARTAYATYQDMEDDLKSNLSTIFTGDSIAINHINTYFANNNPFEKVRNAGDTLEGLDLVADMTFAFGNVAAANYSRYAKLTATEVLAAKALDPNLTTMAALNQHNISAGYAGKVAKASGYTALAMGIATAASEIYASPTPDLAAIKVTAELGSVGLAGYGANILAIAIIGTGPVGIIGGAIAATFAIGVVQKWWDEHGDGVVDALKAAKDGLVAEATAVSNAVAEMNDDIDASSTRRASHSRSLLMISLTSAWPPWRA